MSIDVHRRPLPERRHRRDAAVWLAVTGAILAVGGAVVYLLLSLPPAAVLVGALAIACAIITAHFGHEHLIELRRCVAARKVALARAVEQPLADGVPPAPTDPTDPAGLAVIAALSDSELLVVADAVGVAHGRHSREGREADTTTLPVVTR